MNSFFETLKGLGPAKLGIVGAAVAAVIAGTIMIASNFSGPAMSLLYNQLEGADTSAISGRLDALGVPYQISPEGDQIFVPGDRVLDLRMKLAGEGLPASEAVGYEIFNEGQALGQTGFTQQINKTRAMEGELARTIRNMDIVSAARVHLVLPQRELFTRQTRQPSASIILQTRGKPTDAQIKSIQHLVASAVPDLQPGRISIVDERGNLLASGSDSDEQRQADIISGMDEQRRRYQDRIRSQIEELIGRSIGNANVRAEVTADMDFDRVTTNEEIFDPESQVVRSTNTEEITDDRTDRDGEQAVSVQTNLPDAALGANEGGGITSQANRAETRETTNFDISRKVITRTHEGGGLKKLSVAVMVNGTWADGTGEQEGQRIFTPRSAEDVQKIEQLVRSAVGFDEERGDVVQVVPMQFEDFTNPFEETGPLAFIGLTKEDVLKLANSLMLLIVGILAILLVLRPLTARIIAMGEEAHEAAAELPGLEPAGALAAPDMDVDFEQAEEAELEAMIDLEKVEGRVKASSVRKIGEIIDKHPEEAVAILRNWMYES